MEIKCRFCGKIFEPTDWRQIYCSNTCRDRMKLEVKHERRAMSNTKDFKTVTLKCERKECKFYREHGNHCSILSEVYEDDMACSFFKEKK